RRVLYRSHPGASIGLRSARTHAECHGTAIRSQMGPAMFSIHNRPSWTIPESRATPEAVYLNRRGILKTFGLGMMAASALALSGRAGRAQDGDPTADLY